MWVGCSQGSELMPLVKINVNLNLESDKRKRGSKTHMAFPGSIGIIKTLLVFLEVNHFTGGKSAHG